MGGILLKGKQSSTQGIFGARHLKALSIGLKGKQVQEKDVELTVCILPAPPLLLDTRALASSSVSLTRPHATVGRFLMEGGQR